MRLGFCVSGRGRVMQALLAAREAGVLSFTPAALFLDKTNDLANSEIGRTMNTTVVARETFSSTSDFKAELASTLCASDVDALFLTFDWLLPAAVIERFDPNILNLHMGLLPYVRGRDAIRRAIDDGASFAGATCHRVDAGMDTGPIVVQALTPIKQPQTDSPAAKQAQVERLGFDLFCVAVPIAIQSIRWLEAGRLGSAVNGRVRVAGADFSEGSTCPALDEDIITFSTKYLAAEFAAAP